MTINFSKMHGLGNDYIYINCLENYLENASDIAVRMSDRHFGVGSDGLILIMPSQECDYRMEMYNRDGSRGKMCGNAIRCVGKYLYDFGITDKDDILIETDSGPRRLQLQTCAGVVEQVSVDMGQPVFEPDKIPVIWPQADAINISLTAGGREYRLSCLSMGNPHAVIFADDVEGIDLPGIGPLLENHPMFPDRINVEFVQVIDRSNLRMRVWERGAGETMACGTGACAALAAAVRNGLSDREAVVHLNGGPLYINWPGEDKSITMTGPAVYVFSGEMEIK